MKTLCSARLFALVACTTFAALSFSAVAEAHKGGGGGGMSSHCSSGSSCHTPCSSGSSCHAPCSSGSCCRPSCNSWCGNFCSSYCPSYCSSYCPSYCNYTPTYCQPVSYCQPVIVLPAADLLRAGDDLQLRACHDVSAGDHVPSVHRVRAPVQHVLPAGTDLQLPDLLDALLPADVLPADLQLPDVPAVVLPVVQHELLLPVVLRLKLLSVDLQHGRRLLPLGRQLPSVGRLPPIGQLLERSSFGRLQLDDGEHGPRWTAVVV